MTHTLNVVTTVGPDHTVSIRLPDAVPEGDVELFVVAVPRARHSKTLGDLLKSEIVGMWADRTDIGDGVEFARNLRDNAWRRSSE
jgi:hypothetical protein